MSKVNKIPLQLQKPTRPNFTAKEEYFKATDGMSPLPKWQKNKLEVEIELELTDQDIEKDKDKENRMETETSFSAP